MEHLAGVQAQDPQAPYVALWSRLAAFDPRGLSDLIAARGAVRAPLMRATIHLVSAADWRRMRPPTSAVLDRDFTATRFARALAGVECDALLALGRELLAAKPLTRPELGARLAERWPGADPASLAQAVTYLTSVVQVPPRGLWRQGGAARWTMAEAWLGLQPEAESGRR